LTSSLHGLDGKASASPSGPKRVDLGCGRRQVPGTIGLDIDALPGVEIVADLSRGLPFRDNSLDEVHAIHILEHFDNFIAIMEEIHRACRPNAMLHIKVPHASCSYVTWKDPTHRRGMLLSTFTYFDQTYFDGSAFRHYTSAHFRIERAKLKFTLEGRHSVPRPRRIAEWIVHALANRDRRTQYLCERYWANIVGIEEVELHMRAIKDPAA
jgi:SAM-dependent methyltransferase